MLLTEVLDEEKHEKKSPEFYSTYKINKYQSSTMLQLLIKKRETRREYQEVSDPAGHSTL